MDQLDVKNIFRESFLALTKRITGIELVEAEESPPDMRQAFIISVYTRGPFHGEITCILDNRLMCEIYEKMTGGRRVPKEDQELYVKEYVNIVCGNGLTRINNLMKASSRLTVPCVAGVCRVSYEKDFEKRDVAFHFQSGFGDIRVYIRYAV